MRTGVLMWGVSLLRAKVRELLEKRSADAVIGPGQLTSSRRTTGRYSTTKEMLKKYLDENGISSSRTRHALTSARPGSTGTSEIPAATFAQLMLYNSYDDCLTPRALASQSKTQSGELEQLSAQLHNTFSRTSSGTTPASAPDSGSQDYHSCSQPSTSSHDW